MVSSIYLIFSKMTSLLVWRVYFLAAKDSQMRLTLFSTFEPDSIMMMKAVLDSNYMVGQKASVASLGMLKV